jgi:hypothetical protein
MHIRDKSHTLVRSRSTYGTRAPPCSPNVKWVETFDDPRKHNPSPSPTYHPGRLVYMLRYMSPLSRSRMVAPNSSWSFNRVWIAPRGTHDMHLSTVVTKMEPFVLTIHRFITCITPSRIHLIAYHNNSSTYLTSPRCRCGEKLRRPAVTLSISVSGVISLVRLQFVASIDGSMDLQLVSCSL